MLARTSKLTNRGAVAAKKQPNALVNAKTPLRRARRPPREVGTALQQVIRLVL